MMWGSSPLFGFISLIQPEGAKLQFEYTPPQTDLEEMFGGYYCINAYGSINVGDDEKFVDFLQRLDVPTRTPVYINSTGGDVDAAINIGRTIRDRWFSTHVGQLLLDGDLEDGFLKKRKWTDGKCMSAATLVFLGGRLRYCSDDASFGVHQFSFLNPSPSHIARSQILSSKIARYVTDMGILAEFLEVASSTPNNEIKLLPLKDLKELGVVTGGETAVSWSIQAAGEALYVRGERDNLYGHHKMLLGFAKPNGFFVHVVIESFGRETELSTFPLVELVIRQSEESIIELADRCSRRTQGNYTHITAPLTVSEALVIAQSRGFGIRVRGGADAGTFLGIDVMSIVGGSHLLQSFVSNLS